MTKLILQAHAIRIKFRTPPAQSALCVTMNRTMSEWFIPFCHDTYCPCIIGRSEEVFYAIVFARSMPIVILYLLMVMLSRYLTHLFSPMSLRIPLVIHNVVCVMLSVYTAVQGSRGIFESPSVYHTADGPPLVIHALRLYWISKIFELTDTVFMVLRHKLKQMSFLHVFHHMSILLLADNAYHMAPWPPIGLLMTLNSIVHIFMYTYYGLRAIRPLNEISWKKRITQLQIAQFLFGLLFAANGYLNHGFCVYSMLYGLGLLTLFTNYYYQAFIRKRSSRDKLQ